MMARTRGRREIAVSLLHRGESTKFRDRLQLLLLLTRVRNKLQRDVFITGEHERRVKFTSQ